MKSPLLIGILVFLAGCPSVDANSPRTESSAAVQLPMVMTETKDRLVGGQSSDGALASTKWAYSDSRGRFKELTFASDGVLIVRFLSTTHRKNPDDPSGWGLLHYELKTEVNGNWEEKDGLVRLKIPDQSVVAALSGTSLVDAYDGRLHSGTISGSARPVMGDGWSWTATVIESGGEQKDRSPRVLIADELDHPLIKTLFSEKRIKGSATVRIKIASTGDVSDVAIVSATKKEFGETAKQAIHAWKFLPKIRNGITVDATVEMTVEFIPAK